MSQEERVIVAGAGHAGIASALALKDAGLEPLVLDQADRVASAWRSRYESLRLNTWRPFSHLPGRPFPKGTPTFPSRDQVVEHVERHAAEDGIELRLGIRVDRIDRVAGEWLVSTSEGEMRAPQVIVALGLDHAPFTPDWPGRDAFKGTLIHSAQFRNAEPFQGQSVLVVGPGTSGMEIAHELAEGGAAEVRVAVRTPPNVLLRQGPGPVPGDLIGTWLWHLPTALADRIARFARRMDLGDLTEYGLPVPKRGVFADVRQRGKVPAIVDVGVIDVIKDGRIEIVAAVESLDSSGVELADGTRVEPESVICATGFRRGLEPLVGHLGVLGERGMPKVIGPYAAAEGLRFMGYVERPGGLGYISKLARRSAKAIRRELRAGNRELPGEEVEDVASKRDAAAERVA
jgi:cation diffusion facilitator CzcD-associated flavoprotein CzcO